MTEFRSPPPHRSPTDPPHSPTTVDCHGRADSGGRAAERVRAFTEAVLGLHRVLPAVPGFIPMCSCRLPARCCDIVRAEHEVLGIVMPFSFDPLRPPHVADRPSGSAPVREESFR